MPRKPGHTTRYRFTRYRFLLSVRWLAGLVAAVTLAGAMVLLGQWQLHRYEQRAAINERIAAADPAHPQPLTALVPGPGPTDPVGPPAPAESDWAVVTATGRYDLSNEILVRGRTVEGRVGFEVLTPLLLGDGSAVLVNRGWTPPAPGGAAIHPEVPPAPTGEVTVVGRVRPSESGTTPVNRRDGWLETRRITAAQVAPHLSYRLYDAYLLLDRQAPPAEPGLAAIPPRYENSWLNAGYAAQWWIFAAAVLPGYAWLSWREARRRDRPAGTGPELVATGTGSG